MGITMPSLVFGFMLAALCGSAFHLWRGGNLGRLILYIILACFGFWIGHWVGDTAGLTFASLGPLRVGMGLVGVILFLGIGYWLSLVRDDYRG